MPHFEQKPRSAHFEESKTVTCSSPSISGHVARIRVARRLGLGGFRADGAAWSTNTTFSVCADADASANRAVILYGTGRARTDRKLPGDGAITCT